MDSTIAAAKERKETEKREAAESVAQAAAEVTNENNPTTPPTQAGACNQTGKHSDPVSVTVVVNKKHCMQPMNFTPTDLTQVYGATISAKAAPQFKALYEAAAAAGQGFNVTSSYRSYGNQVSTYQYWVGQSGQAVADTYSARPGYSEHQTGLAVDLAAGGCALDCFGSTSQYQWLLQHAAEYGFIQRYYAGSEAITGYKAEEWHYRYVGHDVALDMQKRGIKTLEELWGIPGGDY